VVVLEPIDFDAPAEALWAGTAYALLAIVSTPIISNILFHTFYSMSAYLEQI
jgi:hypothetical protein